MQQKSSQPQNNLAPAQEDVANKLYHDYKGFGRPLSDIRDSIDKNPQLTEAQLRALLKQYAKVMGAHSI